MAHPARSSDSRAQWTKTSSKINQKWSIQHAWSAIVLNGPENRLVPVEVKAKNGTAKSLRTLIESDTYPDIDWGIKLCGGNVGREGSVLTLPYFTAFLLRRYLAGK